MAQQQGDSTDIDVRTSTLGGNGTAGTTKAYTNAPVAGSGLPGAGSPTATSAEYDPDAEARKKQLAQQLAALSADPTARAITYRDGSRQIKGANGAKIFLDPQGNPIDVATLTSENAGFEAGRDALYQQTGIARPKISFTQSDGSVRPETQDEANADSNRVNGGGIGLPGLGSGGNPIANIPTILGGAVNGALGDLGGADSGPAGNGGAPGGVGQDIAGARNTTAAFAAALANQTPIAAGTQQIAQATGPSWGSLAQSTAAQATGPAWNPLAQATAANPGAAAQAGLVQANPAAQATAAQIAAGNQDAVRQRQLSLADALTATMNGSGPSVAQEQLHQAGDAAIQQQYALAASANGQNVGLGLRNAMQGAAGIGAQNAQTAALLRAQEVATARGQLGGVLDQTRGSDIGIATNQAQLKQQTALANTGFTNDRSALNANLAAALGQFNTGQTNQQQQLAAQLQQQTNLANMTATNDRGSQRAQLAQALALANAGFTQQTNLSNTAAANDRATQEATLAQQLSLGNAGLASSAYANDLNAYMQGQQLTVQQQQNLMSALNTSQGQTLSTGANVYATDQQRAAQQYAADQQRKAAILAAAASGGATLLNSFVKAA